jgi:triosephosphate isomerase (TIM)
MKPLIIGNWKCNPSSLEEAKALAGAVAEGLKDSKDVEVVICPPLIFISSLADYNIILGAQNCFSKEGSFTGEVSVAMLEDMNVKYVILGHSERRNMFNETDEEINAKLIRALQSKITPILCIGEKGEDRGEGKTFEVLSQQLDECLNNISGTENIVIAYEPVWAIGTGKFAEAEDIKEIRIFIQEFLAKKFGEEAAKKVRIIYGGSVDSNNIKSYLSEARMDGVLVGGASLKADEFIKMTKSA